MHVMQMLCKYIDIDLQDSHAVVDGVGRGCDCGARATTAQTGPLVSGHSLAAARCFPSGRLCHARRHTHTRMPVKIN